MPELPEVETIANELWVLVRIGAKLGRNWPGMTQSDETPNPKQLQNSKAKTRHRRTEAQMSELSEFLCYHVGEASNEGC